MDIVILPLNNATLYRWSFDHHIPGNELKWKGEPAYFIRYHEGSLNKHPRPLSFELMFDVRYKNLRNRNYSRFMKYREYRRKFAGEQKRNSRETSV